MNGNVYRKLYFAKFSAISATITRMMWADLALSHYSKGAVTLLLDQNINFIQREDNPLNASKLRRMGEMLAYFELQSI